MSQPIGFEYPGYESESGLQHPTEQQERDYRWLMDNYVKLSFEYAFKYIAIHNCGIVAVARDRETVIKLARERTGSDDIVVHWADDGSVVTAF